MPSQPKPLRAHDLDLVTRPKIPQSPISRGLIIRPAQTPEVVQGVVVAPPVDPYVHHRLAPDMIGIGQITVWCPHCQGSLEVTTMVMTDRGLFVEGICRTCGSPTTGRPGIYKRGLVPLAWGKLPPVEED